MRTLALLSALLLTQAAAAQQVSLNGRLGADSALLVIDGQMRTLRVGQTQAGVKLLQVGDERASVEVGGRRLELRLGADPVAQKGGTASAASIVLRAGSGGHFMAEGSINGSAAQFLVDTGATSVSIGMNDAVRMGIDFRSGQPVRMQTANGVSLGYVVRLNRMRVAGVEVYGVEAIVTSANMPYVLLGNSFLSRFEMRQENDLMTLKQRY
jgi:aspartyl protease family protein